MKPTVSDSSSSRWSGRRTRADQRIERHEQRVRRERVGPRQPVEQRRLARVGVADQRDGRHRGLLAPFAQLRAPPPHVVDLLLQRVDAGADPPAIGFELGFARAAGADAAAQPRQLEPGADQPRQQILQLRELDLQLAFARPRAAREDVEDELRAIDDLAFEPLLQLAQLRRRQLVVEDDDVDVGFGRRAREQLDFAAAEKCRGVRLGTLLQHAQHHVCAGGVGQPGQLFERMLGIDPAAVSGNEPDQCGPLDRYLRRTPRHAGEGS